MFRFSREQKFQFGNFHIKVCGLGSYWIEGRVCTEKGLSGVACERTMNRSRTVYWGFLGGAVVKNPPACAGDLGSIPGPGKSHVLWGNMP